MPASGDRARVVASARAGVAAVAPEELPFFPATAAQYLRRPRRTLAGRGPRGEALGSGGTTVVALVSPVALAVATAVYQQLTVRAADGVTRTSARLGRRLWNRLRRVRWRGRNAGEQAPSSATPLTDRQRSEIRSVAEARARALGLPDEKVTLLVGAIMDGLDHR